MEGTIYVSDGYCNSRVAQFTAEGDFEGDFVLPKESMNVPHSVLLLECSDALVVADRESSKVHRFELSTRTYKGGLQPHRHVCIVYVMRLQLT